MRILISLLIAGCLLAITSIAATAQRIQGSALTNGPKQCKFWGATAEQLLRIKAVPILASPVVDQQRQTKQYCFADRPPEIHTFTTCTIAHLQLGQVTPEEVATFYCMGIPYSHTNEWQTFSATKLPRVMRDLQESGIMTWFNKDKPLEDTETFATYPALIESKALTCPNPQLGLQMSWIYMPCESLPPCDQAEVCLKNNDPIDYELLKNGGAVGTDFWKTFSTTSMTNLSGFTPEGNAALIWNVTLSLCGRLGFGAATLEMDSNQTLTGRSDGFPVARLHASEMALLEKLAAAARSQQVEETGVLSCADQHLQRIRQAFRSGFVGVIDKWPRDMAGLVWADIAATCQGLGKITLSMNANHALVAEYPGLAKATVDAQDLNVLEMMGASAIASNTLKPEYHACAQGYLDRIRQAFAARG